MNKYVKYLNGNKCIIFLVYENEIWDKIRDLLRKGFISEPVDDNKHNKTKIKIYNNRINTNFHSNKVSKDNKCCVSLSAILLHSVFKIGKYYYPQIFLEECKYAVKKKKIMNAINEELNLDESEMSLIMRSLINLMKLKIVF